jgi:NAD(P)-dependent dehydrogenase (short-subunit alcohol dehydrogenase family)
MHAADMTNSSRRVANKVTVVTGGGSGIGEATAKLLAKEGAKVAVADINESAAGEVARGIVSAGGEAFALALDVTSESGWDTAINSILNRWSRLDVLVNCAGISFARPVAEMTLDEWRRVHAVNLDGVFLGTRAAIKTMRRTGGGSILNVASASGLKASPGASAYCSSKAAVIHFSRTAALECQQAGDNIRINVVAPGGVRTPIWKTMPAWKGLAQDGEEAAWKKLDPKGQFHMPEEIASTTLYLVSDDARHVTASVLTLDRGYTA